MHVLDRRDQDRYGCRRGRHPYRRYDRPGQDREVTQTVYSELQLTSLGLTLAWSTVGR